jgi:hypothetical protein
MLVRWHNSHASFAPKLKLHRGHSAAQREVLALYKAWLRAIRAKSVSEERKVSMTRYVRDEFKTYASTVRQLDIDRIEKLMSRGRKQLRHFRLSSGGFEINTIVNRNNDNNDNENENQSR